ncbi:MAG TPA: uroporphyrinogen-III synthase [Rhodanobacteraceae bacterium]|nr:uroporphyrinogen-III synthase [Rhodanobacteraceae bacterium]
MPAASVLAGIHVAITRPAGTGAPFVRRVRALGGTPILLPGLSLRPPTDMPAARAALRGALAGDIVIFTSPAAVRFAGRLLPLRGAAQALAPGRGTRAALVRAGCAKAIAPSRQDSEGILALPALQAIRGLRVALIGAAGGRGVLVPELARRGAIVIPVHVYRRAPARLGQHHARALLAGAAAPLYTLVSSGEALANVLARLPADARRVLLAGTAVVSSSRLAAAAGAAGFARTLIADSPAADGLLRRLVADRA